MEKKMEESKKIYYVKTRDPYPLTKRYFENKKDILNHLLYIKTLLPYKINLVEEGVNIYSIPIEDKIIWEKCLTENSRIKFPTTIQYDINEKLKFCLESKKIETDPEKKQIIHEQIKKLRKYFYKDISSVNFKEFNELVYNA
jgi:hypothetical protein